jgi:hypothetical protein
MQSPCGFHLEVCPESAIAVPHNSMVREMRRQFKSKVGRVPGVVPRDEGKSPVGVDAPDLSQQAPLGGTPAGRRRSDYSSCPFALILRCRGPDREEKVGNGEQGEQGNNTLGDYAVEAPDLQLISLDVSQVYRECQGGQAGGQQTATAPKKCEYAQERVTGDADRGDRYMLDFSEAAVIDDAAVPPFVDAAGLDISGVMDVQGKNGNGDAAGGENEDQETQGFFSGVAVVDSLQRQSTIG